MKGKTLLLIILTVLVTATLYFVTNKKVVNLVGPGVVGSIQQSPNPTPLATPVAPKTFNFDKSTDLQKELESINPQVLDSDFE